VVCWYVCHPEDRTGDANVVLICPLCRRVPLPQALPLTPLASDKLGRRFALFIGACIMLAGVAVQVCAQDIAMLIGARAISECPILLEPLQLFRGLCGPVASCPERSRR